MSRPVWPSQLYNDLPCCLYAMKSIIAPNKIEITLNHRRNTALKDFIIVVQRGSDRIKHSCKMKILKQAAQKRGVAIV